MAVHLPKLSRLAFKLLVLSVCGLWTTTARAEFLTVDPEVFGNPSFAVLAQHTVFPVDPVLEIRFDHMKHVEAIEWGIQQSSGNSLPDNTMLSLFLTDEFGQEIPGTADSFDFGTFGFSGFSVFSALPIIAHGIYLEFELPQEILIDVIVAGQVGQWGEVPEPSTLVLWSLGAVGLVGLGLRRRRQAA